MTTPVLYVFAISHYCEKARWALDYLGIAYQLKPIAPGIHLKMAQKLGLKIGSLPILRDGETIIQGSATIIDWAEKKCDTGKTLTPATQPDAIKNIETRLDDTAGVHVRRYYYSEALVEHPHTVRPLFTKGIPLLHSLIVRYKWNMITQLMTKRMDLGAEQGVQSLNILDKELAWLDGMLSKGQRFLVGDQLSRADIAAASLLAPLVSPDNHPTYGSLKLPPRMKTEMAAWQDRPSLKWVNELYRHHR